MKYVCENGIYAMLLDVQNASYIYIYTYSFRLDSFGAGANIRQAIVRTNRLEIYFDHFVFFFSLSFFYFYF